MQRSHTKCVISQTLRMYLFSQRQRLISQTLSSQQLMLTVYRPILGEGSRLTYLLLSSTKSLSPTPGPVSYLAKVRAERFNFHSQVIAGITI